MPREVDLLPSPTEGTRKVKVVVASPSRSGTLGLYTAMQILGYNTYHIYECAMINGLDHLKIFNEGMTAQHNRLSGIKRFDKDDFDKWMAKYDCIVEIPSYMGTDFLEAYAQDPDVKFILTERDPRKWARSVNNTAGQVVRAANKFPLNILKHFESTLYHFFGMNTLVYRILSAGTQIGDKDNEKELVKFYENYMKMAKATIPADRLCLINLDKDTLDWETICPFLDVSIPKEDYPGRNEPEKFEAMVKGFMDPIVRTAMFRLGATIVGVLGIGWAAVQYGPSFFA
ncbi:uncharacterized protein N7483_004625 [Penicillium malachiteum]|uniref:uncharacterized protein n=1 Tax=Penicillium malachiteum TaxID=1324776 RepID=UPI002547898F|nr:uncharacterized protein N7483_004625 [Penicillium malachiteum]KAJ5730117.1 hypothetical protein N7483_004625 [Penicillium malachiteum]